MNSHPEGNSRKLSAFRERSHHSDNDRLQDLFTGDNRADEKNEILQHKAENDEEYALLLGQLWSKYKNNKVHSINAETAPPGVVKLYKDKIVKKRYPDSWGPVAFKRKRSSDPDIDRPISPDYEADRKSMPGQSDPNYNAYDISDDDKDDWREEYAIAFQPLDDDSLSEVGDDDQYSYDTVEKRFPVTKRSSGPYNFNNQKKRFVENQNRQEKSKSFRSSSGTDPRIIKDLSKIFGNSDKEIIKSPVKRNTDHEEHAHEGKPPKVTGLNHNSTHESSNSSHHDDNSHEQHGHNIHHPGIFSKEVEHVHDHEHEKQGKPITIKKKSIDWSDYFGIDKRNKKSESFVKDMSQDRLRKQYFDTFNKEVIYPLNSFRKHNFVKRNYFQPKSNEDTEVQMNRAQALAIRDEKRNIAKDEKAKIDNINKKLRNMQEMIVDDALHYSNIGDELDSKEEQEMKEKLVSQLAAAYSLEKMRKALREFKQSLQVQRSDAKESHVSTDEAKAKRVAVKKEKVEINNNEIPSYKSQDRTDDFEEEQGAGHYLNGKIEQQYSEGYMGGSGRHRTPVISTGK